MAARGLALGLLRQLLIDKPLEFGEGFGSREEAPVDEEAGGPRDPEALGLLGIAINPLLHLRGCGVALELLHVEANLPGVLDVLLLRELTLVREDAIVHLPEFALTVRRLAGGMSGGCLRVHAEWQVLEHDLHLVGVRLPDLLEGRTDPRTEGSLEVRELDELDLRACGPLRRGSGRVDLVVPVRVGTPGSGWSGGGPRLRHVL